MAKVPRTTTLTETPGGIPEIPAPTFTAEDFGGRQAEALGIAGKAVSDVAGAMQRAQERRDVTKVLDVSKGLEDLVNKQQPEYLLEKKGDTEGLTVRAEEFWDKSYAQAIVGLSKRQLKLMVKRTDPTRRSLIRAVSAHEAVEGRAAFVSSLDSSITSAVNNAAVNASDPDVVAERRNEIVRLSATKSDAEGDSDEDAELRSGQTLSVLHTEVIQALGRNDPDQAEAYYRNYEEDIPGAMRAEFEEMVFAATATAKAQQAGDRAVTKFDNVDDAMVDMRKTTKPGELRRIKKIEIEARFREESDRKKRTQRELFDRAQESIQKGARWTNLDPGDVARMEPGTKAAIFALIENPTGPDKTAWDRWYELDNLPVAELAKVDLGMESLLREQDRKELARRQKAFLSGQPSDDHLLDEQMKYLLGVAFDAMRLESTPSDNETKGAIKDYVGRLRSYKVGKEGHKLTTPEMRSIVAEAVRAGEAALPIKLKGFGTIFEWGFDKRVYELTEKEIAVFTPDEPLPPDVARDLSAVAYGRGGYIPVRKGREIVYIHKDTGRPARKFSQEELVELYRETLLARKRALHAF